MNSTAEWLSTRKTALLSSSRKRRCSGVEFMDKRRCWCRVHGQETHQTWFSVVSCLSPRFRPKTNDNGKTKLSPLYEIAVA